ncbi:MerC family mercury resistance protein [Fodinicurvata halophila]|uniref:MerC family mercury resistance protein n=1 Tax=Fodinicurvata halophila TaxID=1419723 RepID=A0ABV8UR70_9PROT
MQEETVPRRLKGTGRWSLLGAVAAVVALISCYGPLLLIGVLSLLGTSLVLDETLWAGAILAATAVALLALVISFLRHRKPLSLLFALAGGALIFYAFLVSYHVLIEGLGFLLLIVGVVMDLLSVRRKSAR